MKLILLFGPLFEVGLILLLWMVLVMQRTMDLVLVFKRVRNQIVENMKVDDITDSEIVNV